MWVVPPQPLSTKSLYVTLAFFYVKKNLGGSGRSPDQILRSFFVKMQMNWKSHGIHRGTTWKSHGNHKEVVGNHKEIVLNSYGIRMDFVREPLGSRMEFLWNSYGTQRGTIRKSH